MWNQNRPDVKCRLFVLFLSGLCCLSHCHRYRYHFVATALPWLDAQTYCRERHADLATVFNVEDMNRLVNSAQASNAGKVWIGLHDNLTSWRWSFSDSLYYSQQDTGYRNWDFLQPDNFRGNQMCAQMWGGGVWQDLQCSLRNPFVCYDGNANVHFSFVAQKLSWFEAQLHCRKFHTDLASVRNAKENREIQLLAKNQAVWIGLYRAREWSDQRDSTYRHWMPGQPDNAGGTESCAACDLGNAGLWSDERCSRELAFICYSVNAETSVQSTPSTNEVTAHEVTSAEVQGSPQPDSSPQVDRTEHVINVQIKLTSKGELGEDDIKELVSAELYILLGEMGHAASIKVDLKATETRQLVEP